MPAPVDFRADDQAGTDGPGCVASLVAATVQDAYLVGDQRTAPMRLVSIGAAGGERVEVVCLTELDGLEEMRTEGTSGARTARRSGDLGTTR